MFDEIEDDDGHGIESVCTGDLDDVQRTLLRVWLMDQFDELIKEKDDVDEAQGEEFLPCLLGLIEFLTDEEDSYDE